MNNKYINTFIPHKTVQQCVAETNSIGSDPKDVMTFNGLSKWVYKRLHFDLYINILYQELEFNQNLSKNMKEKTKRMKTNAITLLHSE